MVTENPIECARGHDGEVAVAVGDEEAPAVLLQMQQIRHQGTLLADPVCEIPMSCFSKPFNL